MSFYQLGILGRPPGGEYAALLATIDGMIAPFGLKLGGGVDLLDPKGCPTRDSKAAFTALYFGGPEDPESTAILPDLLQANVPIIPIVDELTGFSAKVPASLRAANGVELKGAGPKFEAIAAATLECLGLLRRQRRVFVSYRRVDSANVALQLHEALNARGFDVFLDTHDVRPGEDFQATLWHRLCDSDVMIMLDTPSYFGARWTAAEIGRALAKKIAVLGLVWPEHKPERLTQLREPIFLDKADFTAKNGPLAASVIERIYTSVERLRSRSIAIRHAAIAGALKVAAEQIGGRIEAVGAHRSIKLRLADGRHLNVFPAVGVPTAEALNEVVDNCKALGIHQAKPVPILVYDHIGLHPHWQKHLAWLHENLAVVKSLQISQAAWDLADWVH